MYKFAQCSIKVMLALAMAVYLTACGGGANEETTTPPPVNKPTSSAAEVSSISIESSASSQSSSPASSSAISSSSTSSISSYQRSSSQGNNTPDTTPPSTVKLQSYKIGATSLTFTWDHAVDDQGVFDYQLERDGDVIAVLEYPTYIHEDTGLTPYTSYSYSIRARDNSGNISEASTPVTARTLRLNTTNTSSISTSNSSQSSSSSNESKSSLSSSSLNVRSSSRGASSSTAQPQSIHLQWKHPTQRANGTYLELNEIAGYEIRKKNKITKDVIFIVIEGNNQTDYIMDDVSINDVIDIAVYDTSKLYSDFIPIHPK
jgi:hypothetical protein